MVGCLGFLAYKMIQKLSFLFFGGFEEKLAILTNIKLRKCICKARRNVDVKQCKAAAQPLPPSHAQMWLPGAVPASGLLVPGCSVEANTSLLGIIPGAACIVFPCVPYKRLCSSANLWVSCSLFCCTVKEMTMPLFSVNTCFKIR